MRTVLTKVAATLLTLCLMWPQGIAFAAPSSDQQGELDTLLKVSKPKVVVFDGIDVSDDRVTMKLNGKAKHQTQLLADPPRLLIDLYGTDYQVGVKSVPGKGQRIRGVRGAQYKGPPDMVSRIVVDLSDAVFVGHDGAIWWFRWSPTARPCRGRAGQAAVEPKVETVKAEPVKPSRFRQKRGGGPKATVAVAGRASGVKCSAAPVRPTVRASWPRKPSWSRRCP